MGYKYEEMRPQIFTENGFDTLREITLNVQIMKSKYFDFYDMKKGVCGDSWEMLACIDYLEEKGDIQCLSKIGARQDWVYKKN